MAEPQDTTRARVSTRRLIAKLRALGCVCRALDEGLDFNGHIYRSDGKVGRHDTRCPEGIARASRS